MVARSGRWEERAWWGDDKERIMIRRYAEVNPPADPAKAPNHGAWDCVRVEMPWFQASDADIAKLSLAKPEGRDKAVEWLRGRAKLWRDCGVLARAGERVLWSSVKSEDFTDGEILEKESGLYLDGGYSGRGQELKMEWTALAHKEGKEESSQTLAWPMMPGVWIFLPVKDLGNANLVACRLSPDE